jgi:hypothetical protein
LPADAGSEAATAFARAKIQTQKRCYIGILILILDLSGGMGVRASARLAKVSGLALAVAAMGLFGSGCETGRTTKQHSPLTSISDETTTGKQDPNYVASGEGIPPVPGSPTAAGPDGKQPYDSAYARSSPGSELGAAAPPGEQKKDRFIRQ